MEDWELLKYDLPLNYTINGPNDDKFEHNMCPTCLSKDRDLFLLDNPQKDLLITLGIVIMNTQMLCWECYAMVKKIIRFRVLANLAQTIIKNENRTLLKAVRNLSSLKTMDFIKGLSATYVSEDGCMLTTKFVSGVSGPQPKYKNCTCKLGLEIVETDTKLKQPVNTVSFNDDASKPTKEINNETGDVQSEEYDVDYLDVAETSFDNRKTAKFVSRQILKLPINNYNTHKLCLKNVDGTKFKEPNETANTVELNNVEHEITASYENCIETNQSVQLAETSDSTKLDIVIERKSNFTILESESNDVVVPQTTELKNNQRNDTLETLLLSKDVKVSNLSQLCRDVIIKCRLSDLPSENNNIGPKDKSVNTINNETPDTVTENNQETDVNNQISIQLTGIDKVQSAKENCNETQTAANNNPLSPSILLCNEELDNLNETDEICTFIQVNKENDSIQEENTKTIKTPEIERINAFDKTDLTKPCTATLYVTNTTATENTYDAIRGKQRLIFNRITADCPMSSNTNMISLKPNQNKARKKKKKGKSMKASIQRRLIRLKNILSDHNYVTENNVQYKSICNALYVSSEIYRQMSRITSNNCRTVAANNYDSRNEITDNNRRPNKNYCQNENNLQIDNGNYFRNSQAANSSILEHNTNESQINGNITDINIENSQTSRVKVEYCDPDHNDDSSFTTWTAESERDVVKPEHLYEEDDNASDLTSEFSDCVPAFNYYNNVQTNSCLSNLSYYDYLYRPVDSEQNSSRYEENFQNDFEDLNDGSNDENNKIIVCFSDPIFSTDHIESNEQTDDLNADCGHNPEIDTNTADLLEPVYYTDFVEPYDHSQTKPFVNITGSFEDAELDTNDNTTEIDNYTKKSNTRKRRKRKVVKIRKTQNRKKRKKSRAGPKRSAKLIRSNVVNEMKREKLFLRPIVALPKINNLIDLNNEKTNPINETTKPTQTIEEFIASEKTIDTLSDDETYYSEFDLLIKELQTGKKKETKNTKTEKRTDKMTNKNFRNDKNINDKKKMTQEKDTIRVRLVRGKATRQATHRQPHTEGTHKHTHTEETHTHTTDTDNSNETVTQEKDKIRVRLVRGKATRQATYRQPQTEATHKHTHTEETHTHTTDADNRNETVTQQKDTIRVRLVRGKATRQATHSQPHTEGTHKHTHTEETHTHTIDTDNSNETVTQQKDTIRVRLVKGKATRQATHRQPQTEGTHKHTHTEETHTHTTDTDNSNETKGIDNETNIDEQNHTEEIECTNENQDKTIRVQSDTVDIPEPYIIKNKNSQRMYKLRYFENGELEIMRQNTINSDRFKNAQFKCFKCVRIFARKAFLIRHITASHTKKTGDKVCNICGATKQHDLMMKHKLSHNKCYVCRWCPNEFLHFDYLKEHVEEIHPEEFKTKKKPENRIYICRFCEANYTCYRLINEHLHSKHYFITPSMKMDATDENPSKNNLQTTKTMSNVTRNFRYLSKYYYSIKMDETSFERIKNTRASRKKTYTNLRVLGSNSRSKKKTRSTSSVESSLTDRNFGIWDYVKNLPDYNLNLTENNSDRIANNSTSTGENSILSENNSSVTENNLSLTTENNHCSADNNLSLTENNHSIAENNLCMAGNNFNAEEKSNYTPNLVNNKSNFPEKNLSFLDGELSSDSAISASILTENNLTFLENNESVPDNNPSFP